MTEEKDVLDQLLEGYEASLAEQDEKLAPLLHEINLIQDPSIRVFVRRMLLRADDFWLGPSSVSGRFHPPDEHGEGGNVLHTRRVVKAVELFCESKDRTATERDILLAAALLHDYTKCQFSNGVWYSDPLHPYTLDGAVSQSIKEDKKHGLVPAATLVEPDLLSQILRLVRCSHGIWSPVPETIPLTNMEWILHDCDYIASKLHEFPGVLFNVEGSKASS